MKVFKFLGVLLISIVVLWLIVLVFNNGFGLNINGQMKGGHMGFNLGMGYGAAGSVAAILQIVIQILFVLFIIGLVVGIIVLIKRYLFTSEDIGKVKETFAGNKKASAKTCEICGKGLEEEWKVCPYCGKEVLKEKEEVS